MQQRLAGAVRDAARTAFDIPLETVSFQYPPRVELGDLALTAPFDLAKTLRRKPRDIAAELGREAGQRSRASSGPRWPAAGTSTSSSTAAPSSRELHGSSRRAAGAASPAGRVIVEHTSINPNKAAHIGHLRNACLGRHLRPAAPPPGLRGRHPELHRRHRGPGGGRGRGLLHLEKKAPGRGRGDRGALRPLLLGPLREGGRLLRRRPGPQGAPGRDPPRHRGRGPTTPPGWRPTSPPGSSRPTSPRWRGSGSTTTCWPTRATSCTSTSGTGPSSS